MKKYILALSMLISFMTIVTQPRADDTDLFVIRLSPDALIILDMSSSMNQCPDGASRCCTNYDNLPNCYRYDVDGKCIEILAAPKKCMEYNIDRKCIKECFGLRKLDIARQVIFDLLNDYRKDETPPGLNPVLNNDDEKSLNLRIGYMRFYGATGDAIKNTPDDDGNPKTGFIQIPEIVNNRGRGTGKYADIGASYEDIWNTVQMDGPWGSTPLAATLAEAKTYYLNDVNFWNDERNVIECRKKYVVFITDGGDTLACGGYPCFPFPFSDSPKYWTTDYKMKMKTVLRAKELLDAKVSVFFVGFGGDMPEWQKRTLNWAAKYGGTDNPLIAPGDRLGDPKSYKLDDHLSPGADPCAITDPACDVDPVVACSSLNPTPTGCSKDPANYPLTGYAFFATDASELSKALKKIIEYIKEKSYAYTAPSVPTVRMVEGDAAYISYITPKDTPFWQGNLKAFQLLEDGTVEVDNPTDKNPINPKWDAGEKLNQKSPSERIIYTYVRGARTAFVPSNLTKEDLAVVSDSDRDKLILHIRGQDTYDIDPPYAPSSGYDTHDRSWKLGDIFHSNAAIVGEPSRFFVDAGFNGSDGFYGKKKKRTRVVIVGANDGMLHAFNAGNWNETKGTHDIGTGAEEWAFIPNSLLQNLKLMASAHTYYVDSSPKVADVWFYADPADTTKSWDEWRTVLVCGLRKGGKHYFALDITDTLDPKYLWEFPKTDDPKFPNYQDYQDFLNNKLGQSWSEPAIGRVRKKVGSEIYERWVAFIGGGFDTSAKGRAFFVVDIKTGEIIKEFSGLEGMSHALAAPPSAVDTLGSGYINKVYIGDLGGQMWVFDVSSTDIAEWSGKRLFKAPGGGSEKHPIYYQPAVALDKTRTPWVFFGTGDRENPTDMHSDERFYAVKDDGKGNYPREEEKKDLRDVTTYSDITFKTPEDPLKGWYIQLAEAEKVLAKPAVFYNLLYFTTYTHISTDECKTTGKATLYKVEYLSGGGAYVLDYYLQGTPSKRSEEIGEGIPSAPVISVNLQGKASVTIGTTSDKILSKETISPTTNKETLYWREVIP